MKLVFLLSAVCFAASSPLDPLDALDQYIESNMNKVHMPSLSAIVVHNDIVLWEKAYGDANPFTGCKATLDKTPYLLASMSKTVMASTLMQLYDQGKFKLDDDINTYLDKYPKAGFRVTNPHFPKEPITFRMLLTHTSSITDGEYEKLPDKTVYSRGKDSPTSLSQFMYDYFAGKWHTSKCFLNHSPGHHFEYSNIGAALAGYMVEVVGGTDFAVTSMANVLKPLNMSTDYNNWHLDPFKDQSILALPCDYYSKTKKYCQYTFPDYPDGGLRVTAHDITKHLIQFIQFGTYENAQILQAETVKEMRQKQDDILPGAKGQNQGLIWYYAQRATRELLGHDGSEMGVSTQYWFHVPTNVGVVMLMNGDWQQTKDYQNVVDKMTEHFFDVFETKLFAEGKIDFNPEDAPLNSGVPPLLRSRENLKSRRAIWRQNNLTAGDLCDF